RPTPSPRSPSTTTGPARRSGPRSAQRRGRTCSRSTRGRAPRSSPRMTPRLRAFTLIEVLLSLVIFALTAIVLGGAYVNVLNSYEAAQQENVYDADVSYARSQLLTQSDLPTAQAGAEFDDGDRHVKWTAEADPANTTDLFTVTFTCVLTDPGTAPA